MSFKCLLNNNTQRIIIVLGMLPCLGMTTTAENCNRYIMNQKVKPRLLVHHSSPSIKAMVPCSKQTTVVCLVCFLLFLFSLFIFWGENEEKKRKGEIWRMFPLSHASRKHVLCTFDDFPGASRASYRYQLWLIHTSDGEEGKRFIHRRLFESTSIVDAIQQAFTAILIAYTQNHV